MVFFCYWFTVSFHCDLIECKKILQLFCTYINMYFGLEYGLFWWKFCGLLRRVRFLMLCVETFCIYRLGYTYSMKWFNSDTTFEFLLDWFVDLWEWRTKFSQYDYVLICPFMPRNFVSWNWLCQHMFIYIHNCYLCWIIPFINMYSLSLSFLISFGLSRTYMNLERPVLLPFGLQ